MEDAALRTMPRPLYGWRVLVVEHDHRIAQQACSEIRSSGADIVGPASCEEDARALIASEPIDCAVVDFNLSGRKAISVVDMLMEEHVPVLLTTGHDQEGLPPEYRGLAHLPEPSRRHHLIGGISDLLNMA